LEPVSLSQRHLAAARSGDPGELDTSLAELRDVRPAAIEGDSARIAFWLNVYNARVVQALRERPRSGHLFRHRRLFRRAACEVGGYSYSLDAIEHGLLRENRRPPFALRRTLAPGDPRFAAAPSRSDPRIHFALNCGAVSCPPIRAYDEVELDAQLGNASRAYLEAESTVDAEKGTVVLPGLMRLYQADFEEAGGALEFALGLLPTVQADGLRAHPHVRLGWSRFDWTLAG